MAVNYIQKMLVNNTCYKNKTTLKPIGLMIHSVGCPQPKAQVFINNMNKTGYSIAVHGYIEPDNVYQTLPFNVKANHCGSGTNGTGNTKYIAFELTEPSTIKYTAGATFKDNDKEKTLAHVKATYDKAVEVFADLCNKYDFDPTKDGVIISHSEGHARGIASAHADVEHLWSKCGLTMDQFRKDVDKELIKLKKADDDAKKETAKKEEAKKEEETASKTIKVGSKVRVKKGATTYTGGKLASFVYSTKYDVISINRDRVVIGLKGVVTAAIKLKNLYLA